MCSVTPEVDILCQFEVALRNALACQVRARRVIASHADRQDALMEKSLTDLEHLIAVVTTIRSMLTVETRDELYILRSQVIGAQPPCDERRDSRYSG